MSNQGNIQLMSRNDILELCGRPSGICDFIKSGIESGNFNPNDFESRMIVDTDETQKDGTRVNAAESYQFCFIPVEAVEQRIIVDKIDSDFGALNDIVIDEDKIDGISKQLQRERNKLTKIEDKFRQNPNLILNASCIMALYVNEKIIDVYTVVPNFMMQLLKKYSF